MSSTDWKSCESWTKKFVRYQVYRHIYVRLGWSAFQRSRFLYLAGGDGGDASVLQGLGVRPYQQLAVDRDASALTAFASRFPDVPTFCGDMADAQGDFDVIFADLYANVSAPWIGDCLAATSARLGRRDDRFFVFAIMEGREQRAVTTDIIAFRARLEQLAQGRPEWNRDQQKLNSAKARIFRAVPELYQTLSKRHIGMKPEFIWRYFGRNVPMVIGGFSTKAFPAKWAEDKFRRKLSAWQLEEEASRDAPLPFCLTFKTLTRVDVMDYIAYFNYFDGLAPDLFNVSRGQIAAYKAHRTRGTYGTVAA